MCNSPSSAHANSLEWRIFSQFIPVPFWIPKVTLQQLSVWVTWSNNKSSATLSPIVLDYFTAPFFSLSMSAEVNWSLKVLKTPLFVPDIYGTMIADTIKN